MPYYPIIICTLAFVMKTKDIHTRFHIERTTDRSVNYGRVDLKVMPVEYGGQFIDHRFGLFISLN